MTARVRVIIADDDPFFRRALGRVVETMEGIDLVALAGDAEEAIESATLHRPDVALIDVRMPRGGGARAAQGIRGASPSTRIITLSAYDDETSVNDMIRERVDGYLVKGASADEIRSALLQSSGEPPPLSDTVTGRMMEQLAARLEAERREGERLMAWRQRLRRIAGGQDRIELHFQPIVTLADDVVVGFEALSRFPGTWPPDVWFGEAAAAGMDVELQMAAVNGALSHLAQIPKEAFLTINVAPQTLNSEQLHEAIEAVPKSRLVIELTETSPIEDYAELGAALVRLKERGIRFAVDDVGAGYASLRHVLQLDPDFVKLDVTIARGIDLDPRRAALVESLVAFAHRTGATVVAEGIETPEELEVVKGLGVTHGQGYYLGRPAPLASQQTDEAGSRESVLATAPRRLEVPPLP